MEDQSTVHVTLGRTLKCHNLEETALEQSGKRRPAQSSMPQPSASADDGDRHSITLGPCSLRVSDNYS